MIVVLVVAGLVSWVTDNPLWFVGALVLVVLVGGF